MKTNYVWFAILFLLVVIGAFFMRQTMQTVSTVPETPTITDTPVPTNGPIEGPTDTPMPEETQAPLLRLPTVRLNSSPTAEPSPTPY